MIVNRPTISVIVPVYNAEKVLCRCVTSILHQSYSDFEILLINDGSSDSSGGICEQFSVEDCRVRVFHQVNGGVSSARNKGLSEARGEYLCFIDSDDWVDSDFFSLIIKSLRSHDMVFFGGRVEKLSGEQLEIMSPLSMQTSEDAFSDIVFSLFKNGILGYMCFMAIKLDLVRNNRIRFREDISIHEDSIFCYQCLFKASRIASLDIQPYHYVSYTGEKITLSSRIPDNYCCIVIERIKEMERLAVIKEIPFDKKEYILKNEVDYVKDDYDFIIIDCPPSLNMLTINSMTTADSVLVPIQCEYYALEGLSQLIHTINLVKERLNPDLRIDGVVFTMYDSRTNLSMQVVENVKQNLNQKVYNTLIPRNIRLAEAPSYGMPINMYDPKSAGAEAYMQLAEEVIKNK